MPVTTTEIAKYSTFVHSDGNPNLFAATVWLYGTSSQCIGFIGFYRDGVAAPGNHFRSDLGYPLVSYRYDSFASTLDLLRNEKPLYFTWYDYLPTRAFASIGTSREPIGENEAP